MKRWLGLFAILAVAAVAVLGYLRWQSRPSLAEERFMRIQHGMTLDEARAIMGRREDDFCKNRRWKVEKEVFYLSLDADDRVLGKGISRGPKSGKPDYSDY